MAFGLLQNYVKGPAYSGYAQPYYPSSITDEEDPAPPEPSHFSNFQPRTDAGQFDGGPQYPDQIDDTPTTHSATVPPAAMSDGIDPQLVAARPSMDVSAIPPPAVASPQESQATGQALGGQPASAVMDDGPPPNLTDKRGRPIPNTSISDPSERTREYNARLGNYEPQPAKGWTRYLKPMLAGALAGGRSGSPFGMLGGAAAGALGGAIKPEAEDERWKAGKQTEVTSTINDQQEQLKNAAQIAHTQAETKKLNAPVVPVKRSRIVKDKEGVYRAVDALTGLDESGKPVQGAVAASATGAFKGWVHDADGVAHYFENGADSGRIDPGRNKVKLPDGRLVDPSQSYTAELGAGREDRATERQNEAARQENARIQANIKAANDEKAGIWAERAKTSRYVSRWTRDKDNNPVKEDVDNPVWNELTRRGNALDDDIRRFNGQLKPEVTPNAAPSPAPTGGKKYKVPAKFL